MDQVKNKRDAYRAIYEMLSLYSIPAKTTTKIKYVERR